LRVLSEDLAPKQFHPWTGLPSLKEEAYLDDGIVDAYIEMCARYVNSVRESWRLSRREFVGLDDAKSVDSKSVEPHTGDSTADDRKHIIVLPYREFVKVIDAAELGDPGRSPHGHRT
jgi:hypothetical protein